MCENWTLYAQRLLTCLTPSSSLMKELCLDCSSEHSYIPGERTMPAVSYKLHLQGQS